VTRVRAVRRVAQLKLLILHEELTPQRAIGGLLGAFDGCIPWLAVDLAAGRY
jgi:hypothetical protein